ncbi:MAG: carboxymuconolactone decarboxylase family protein [Bryobacterales bacterium]|nr:carboxymuconolactone decarboxylase family protein [Bryobacterales bacterium]
MKYRVTALLLVFAAAGLAQYRMPPIPADKFTPEQKKALELVQRPPRPPVGTTGPFIPLLRSPELMNRLQETGAYLRFQSSLPQKLVNMIALLTARYYTQQYEWDGNYPMSIKNGLSPAIADAIGDGRRPANMDADEEMLYNFVTELLQNKSISDPSYERMIAKFGEKGAVEAAATVGYYSTLAGIMNMARSPRQPDSKAPKLAPLPH